MNPFVPSMPPPPNRPKSFWLPCAAIVRPSTSLSKSSPAFMTEHLRPRASPQTSLKLAPVHDGRAEILHVVHPGFQSDAPRLGRAESELQPERTGADRACLARERG